MIELKVDEKIIPIDQIDPNSWNPNEMADFMSEKLRMSLERFGQVAEVLVRQKPDGRYEIIDGEHRFREAKVLGETELLCNDLGVISDDKAKMLTLAMNELHGERNPVRLSKLLNTLHDGPEWDFLKEALPFTDLELENLFSLSVDKEDFDAAGGHVPEEKSGVEKDWSDIKISVPEDGAEEFQKLLYKGKQMIGVEKMADPALENGVLLKELLARNL